MAISTHTVSIAGTWTKADLINQWEDAFEWLEWHGDTKTGLIIGISTFTGGDYREGTSDADHYDVFAKSTSGIGTGASFSVDLSNGGINHVRVNRPGYGYTGGEEITIDGADIDRTSGVGDISFKVAIASTITNAVSYAITATDYFVLSGTDRNGVVSGKATSITIKEGDTLKFDNNISNSSYRLNIVWNCDEQSGTSVGSTNRVFNVYGQNAIYNTGEMFWTPVSGQAGTYLVRDDNGNEGISGVGTITVLPASPSDVTALGYGSTTTFYAKNTTNAYPYGVLRHVIAENKKFGDTYRGFSFRDTTNIVFSVGSAFSPHKPWDSDHGSSANGGSQYPERMAGNSFLDTYLQPQSTQASLTNSSHYQYTQNGYTDGTRFQTGGNTTEQLDLNIYRSSLDPKFVVMSYKAPTVSSTKLRENTFDTIVFHNFTNDNLWDNDDLFLGGYTQIIPSADYTNDNLPSLEFRTSLTGNHDDGNNRYPSKRMAEFGYEGIKLSGTDPYYVQQYCSYYIQPTNNSAGGSTPMTFDHGRVYYRNASDDPERSWGGVSQQESGNQYDKIGAGADFNAVVKGIPLNGNLIPVPYYIPDDFVIINFHYSNPNTNISQGDTITISGSEVYTVITGSYNQDTHTRGILFCARST